MHAFLHGMLSACSAAIALFFLKFLRKSKDRLYGFFAAAFAMLSVEWLTRAMLSPRHGNEHYLFVIRLVAFVLIIAGIVGKNRSKR